MQAQEKYMAEDVVLFREEIGFTQAKLADELGVSVTTIQNWEAGDKKIAAHNQEKLSKLSRKVWMERVFKVSSFISTRIEVLTIHTLLKNKEDEVAIDVAEYFVENAEIDTFDEALVRHFASLAYIISDGNSETALEHSRRALQVLAENEMHSNPLAASVENTIIGEGIVGLLKSPDGFAKQRRAITYIQSLVKIYEKRSMPAYLWNALGLACAIPLPTEISEILQKLIDDDEVGVEEVKRRVSSKEHLVAAQNYLELAQEG